MYVLSTNHHRLNQNTYIEEDLRYPGQACVIFKENEDGIGVLFLKNCLSLLGLFRPESDASPVLIGSACAY